MDHLTPLGWEVIPFYCDPNLHFYQLSQAQLYSNTPSDFDFKLANTARPLSESELIEAFRKTDIVFPVIHGEFGEDGKLQELLESNGIPFVGSSSDSCRRMFDKLTANRNMGDMGFSTLPNCYIEENDTQDVRLRKVTDFFNNKGAERLVVKPSSGGSSIGVAIAETPQEAVTHAEYILTHKLGGKAMIEPFCKGREFTVIILQNGNNEPVALIPTEIELKDGELFTYRSKYLPSRSIENHCPPRFSDEVVELIRRSVERLFKLFDMRDFCRVDGRISDDKQLYFTDINPISGMEQNSYLFIQGSRVGLSHSEMLRYVVSHAARRYGIDCSVKILANHPGSKKVRVLFGGETAERQVSLMSGTNVWLKLSYAENYLPSPYLLAPNHDVWELPYSFSLDHTVEEIHKHCTESETVFLRLKVIVPPILEQLGLPSLVINALTKPRRMSFDQFCKEATAENAFVFIALHGGEGEDGRVQAILNRYMLAYNGSDEKASKLCMDKYMTGKVISNLHDPLLISAPKFLIPARHAENPEKIWNDAIQALKTSDILIKPQADGCSAGVVRVRSAKDLELYLEAIDQGKTSLTANTLACQPTVIELPEKIENAILEPFIVTDDICVSGLELVYKLKTGWIELTVGVLEDEGIYHALSPSITIAQSNVLSLEEKFQGGTGVNLTPPPDSIISMKQIDLIKAKIEKAAKALDIQGYARIDIFFNTKSNQTMLIEANTLPGLTPSTVIYHQALAELPPIYPQAFLSKLVDLGVKRRVITLASISLTNGNSKGV